MSEQKDNALEITQKLNATLERLNAVESELQKSKMDNEVIKIHSKWSDFSQSEGQSIEFLKGVNYAIENAAKFAQKVEVDQKDNSKPVAELKRNDNSVSDVRMGVQVIDEDDANYNRGGQI